jgi:hypothetical protein
VRLTAKLYRLDEDGKGITKGQTNPIYRLAPGCAINELVADIANNPLRIMVISENYFKSQVCLNELCLSLCVRRRANQHIENNRLPLLLLSGFADDTKVLKDGEFTFESCATPKTLI